jgi:hypothetical protein
MPRKKLNRVRVLTVRRSITGNGWGLLGERGGRVSCLRHVSGLKTLDGRVKEVEGYLRTGMEAPGRTAP